MTKEADWKPLYEEKWLKLEGLVLYSHMLADSMRSANNQMEDRQFSNGAAGAFHLMAFALEEAYNLMNEYDERFKIHENWGLSS